MIVPGSPQPSGNGPSPDPGPMPSEGNLLMAAATMDSLGTMPKAAESSNYLQDQRSRFNDEMQAKPELRGRLRAILSLENENAGPGVVESLMNRQSMTGGSLEQGMGGGANSFYNPVRKGLVEPRMRQIDRSPTWQARLDRSIDQALAGSNVVKGHTDQGSAGDPNYNAGGVGVNIAGERFNHWGGFKGVEYSRQWTADQQAKVAAGAPYTASDTEGSASAAESIAKDRAETVPPVAFMQAGKYIKTGELAEGPSENIEHREGDEGPIQMPSEITKIMDRFRRDAITRSSQGKMADSLGTAQEIHDFYTKYFHLVPTDKYGREKRK